MRETDRHRERERERETERGGDLLFTASEKVPRGVRVVGVQGGFRGERESCFLR
jgi:hypothetical protein